MPRTTPPKTAESVEKKDPSSPDVRVIRGLRRVLVEALTEGNNESFELMAPALSRELGGCSVETIRLLLQPFDHPDHTGLDCPDCGAKQAKLNMFKSPDGSMTLRVSAHFAPSKVNSELNGLGKLFKAWKTST